MSAFPFDWRLDSARHSDVSVPMTTRIGESATRSWRTNEYFLQRATKALRDFASSVHSFGTGSPFAISLDPMHHLNSNRPSNHVIDVNRRQSARFQPTWVGLPRREDVAGTLRRSRHHERWSP